MPATASRKARLYTADEAAEIFGERERRNFLKKYADLFTDARPPNKRGNRTPRVFLVVEVDLALSDGWEALADFQQRMGRK